MQLERRGVPAVLVTTRIFEVLAVHEAKRAGMPNARIVVIDHPLGVIPPDELQQRIDVATERVIALVGAQSAPAAELYPRAASSSSIGG